MIKQYSDKRSAVRGLERFVKAPIDSIESLLFKNDEGKWCFDEDQVRDALQGQTASTQIKQVEVETEEVSIPKQPSLLATLAIQQINAHEAKTSYNTSSSTQPDKEDSKMTKSTQTAAEIMAEAAAKKQAEKEAKAAKKAAEKAAEKAAAPVKAGPSAEEIAAKAAADAKKAELAAKKKAEDAAVKAAEKAKKAAEKAAAKAESDAAKKAAKVIMPEQNGQKRPKPEGKTGKAWALMDELSAAKNGPISAKELIPVAEAKGMNLAMVRSQYASWKKFHGLVGRIESAPSTVAPQPTN